MAEEKSVSNPMKDLRIEKLVISTSTESPQDCAVPAGYLRSLFDDRAHAHRHLRRRVGRPIDAGVQGP